jgi:hypothetical protein
MPEIMPEKEANEMARRSRVRFIDASDVSSPSMGSDPMEGGREEEMTFRSSRGVRSVVTASVTLVVRFNG